MTMTTKELLALVGAVLLLSGCSIAPAATPDPVGDTLGRVRVVSKAHTVFRFDDDERGVTCYVAASNHDISCVAKEPK